jgi:hypothetical protein
MKYIDNFFSKRFAKELPKTVGEWNIGDNKKKLGKNNCHQQDVKINTDLQNTTLSHVKHIVPSKDENNIIPKKE